MNEADELLTLIPHPPPHSLASRIKSKESQLYISGGHLRRQGLYLRTRALIEGEDGLKKD